MVAAFRSDPADRQPCTSRTGWYAASGGPVGTLRPCGRVGWSGYALIFPFDQFELDGELLELRRSGSLVKAERTVLATLACLVRSAGRLVTKAELVDEVWEGRPVSDSVITVAVARLRKTLGQRKGEPAYIENVYGRGYRFTRNVVTHTERDDRAPALVDSGASDSSFVGRERVLHRLQQALAESRRGAGRLCALMGEAGIGKTQVVEELTRDLGQSEVVVSWGFCHELSNTAPLSPWRRSLGPLLALLGQDELDSVLGRRAAQVQQLLDGGDLAPLEQAIPGLLTAGGSRYDLFDCIARAVAFAAEKAPIVLVFDDLHRADAASLELLAQIVGELRRTRLLIIATLRDGHEARRAETHLAYALGHRNCERIVLETLGRADVLRYVGALLDDPNHALGEAVFQKCEGNPFFMAELTRQLCDMDPPRADALSVPQAALELLHQRIALLEATTREALSAAAVLGRSFSFALLQDVAGSEPAALMACLDEAVGAELLVAAPDSANGFAFGHELLRAALYEALLPSERRGLHLRAARALERRRDAGDTVPSSDLAYHYHRAMPESDLRKVVEHCRAAAWASSAVFANAEVARYMRQALEALDLMENPSQRLRLALLQTISMHTRTTHPAEFARATRETVRLASELGDVGYLVMIGGMLNPSLGLPPAPDARTAYSRALELLGDKGRTLRALALTGLAGTAPTCYDDAEVTRLLDEALELVGAAPEAPDLSHAVNLARLYLRGGPAHAEQEAQARRTLQALVREHERRMPVLPGELALSRGVTALQRGQEAAAVEALERAIQRYRQIDQREGLWLAERARVLLQINAGRVDASVSALLALHERAERLPLPRTAPFRAFDRAVVLSELGHKPALDEPLRRSLAYESTDPPSIWAMKVRALATAGWVETAHASLHAVAPERLAALPSDRDYLGTLGHLVRAALLLDAKPHAEALHSLLEPHAELFSVHIAFFTEGPVAQLLGMLSLALGRPAEAIARFQSAIALAERVGLPERAAEARTALAECRTRH